jgi:hypothetical protein
MSPQHAKMFLFLSNLKRYEDKFGEIKLPTGMIVEEDAQQPTV